MVAADYIPAEFMIGVYYFLIGCEFFVVLLEFLDKLVEFPLKYG